MEIRFVADVMLGKLAKWLRILGYDAHYQPFYKELVMDQYINDGRLLLTRHKSITNNYTESILINADKVSGQLHEMKDCHYIASDSSMWLTRCLICNIPLQAITREAAQDRIPEYVFHQNHKEFRFCGSCGRCFWPGSHRDRIINQLKRWGF